MDDRLRWLFMIQQSSINFFRYSDGMGVLNNVVVCSSMLLCC